jgi:N-acetylmuramoyl-L-alanine amidase
MDLGISLSRRSQYLGITGILLLAFVLPGFARNLSQEKEAALAAFDTAEQMRQELKARPADQRTRRDYQRVTDAYRRVFNTAPTCNKADDSAFNTAELLAETGRRFNEPKTLQAAIKQYEFLRREYPGSKHRIDALFAIAQIYKDDLHDTAQARATLQDFLTRYPRSRLGEQARAAMASLEHPQPQKKETPREADTRDSVAAPKSTLPMVTGIRHWSTRDYTRVAIDLDSEVQYQAGRIPDPDRIFFDLHDTRLASALIGKSFEVQDGFLRKIRVAPFARGITRVVLEVDDVSDYSAFLLPNPYRLIIDIHGRRARTTFTAEKKTPRPEGAAATKKSVTAEEKPATARAARTTEPASASRTHSDTPLQLSTRVADGSTAPLKPQPENVAHPAPAIAAEKSPAPASAPQSKTATSATAANRTSRSEQSASKSRQPRPSATHADADTTTRTAKVTVPAPAQQPDAALQPAVEKKNTVDDSADLTMARLDAPELKTSRPPTSAPTFESVAPREKSSRVHTAEPTASGDRSLIRALGLKIGKIVVDAGHGGHDTGTIGPTGLQEKDLVLDVALRLGKLLETKLGAEVVYTRDNDTFVPLETRTAIANQNQADLFISVHANSSRDASARGVETYYLNFTSSADALEVAARENAVSEKSVFQLQDLVKRIALKEKIEESREFASDVQTSLWSGESAKSPGLKNRGVKKAPFIVLIGANMPSILAEISFVSNPADEKRLKTPEYRQKIAEYLYRGVARYANGLSGVKVAQRRESSR